MLTCLGHPGQDLALLLSFTSAHICILPIGTAEGNLNFLFLKQLCQVLAWQIEQDRIRRNEVGFMPNVTLLNPPSLYLWKRDQT